MDDPGVTSSKEVQSTLSHHGQPWSAIAHRNTTYICLHLLTMNDPGVTSLTQIQTYISYHGPMDNPGVTLLTQIQTYISYHGPMDNPGVTLLTQIQPLVDTTYIFCHVHFFTIYDHDDHVIIAFLPD